MTGAWRTGAGRRGPAGPGDGARQNNVELKKPKKQKKSRWIKNHGLIEEGSAGARGPPAEARAERNWCWIKKWKNRKNKKIMNHGLLDDGKSWKYQWIRNHGRVEDGSKRGDSDGELKGQNKSKEVTLN